MANRTVSSRHEIAGFLEQGGPRTRPGKKSRGGGSQSGYVLTTEKGMRAMLRALLIAAVSWR
jgi:hypothetical protein